MAKGIKVLLIVAGALALLGVALLVVAWLLGGFDHRVDRKSETVGEAFNSVSVDEITADLRIQLAQDGVCRVDYGEIEDMPLEIRVENGTLLLQRSDNRPWYKKIDLFFRKDFGATTLYLPKEQLDALTLKTVTGDVRLETVLTVVQADLKTTTGDIIVGLLTAENADVRNTTGDIRLENVRASQGLGVECVTGDLTLRGCTAGGSLRVKTVTGDLTLTDCDADGGLSLQTTTGDVRAELRSAKRFTTHCVTGRVNVPASVDGAPECSISCVTGDITATVQPKQ